MKIGNGFKFSIAVLCFLSAGITSAGCIETMSNTPVCLKHEAAEAFCRRWSLDAGAKAAEMIKNCIQENRPKLSAAGAGDRTQEFALRICLAPNDTSYIIPNCQ